MAEDKEGPAEGPAPQPGEEKPEREELHRAGPLPQPDFRMFLSGLAGQAAIHLGLIENPATGKREQDLQQAKYTIDLLQVIKDKTKGNLDPEEEKALDGILYDLRMRYVEACR